MEISDGFITGGSAFFGSIMAIGLAVVKVQKWLQERFEKVEDRFDQKIDQHEKVDQARHEDNLRNFTDIRIQMVALRHSDRMISPNGGN